METHTFTSKVIANGRISIPKYIRTKESIKEGDMVQVQLTKIELKNNSAENEENETKTA